jgi:large repetitive protein
VRTKEVKYNVRYDERPIVDVISPLNGAKVVESSQLGFNVNAFDDVGIDSLRLKVLRGPAQNVIYDVKLRAPPYQFAVNLPAFDPAGGAGGSHRHLRGRVW